MTDTTSTGREGQDATAGATAGEDVSADLERLRDEIGALNDRHLRLAAEFDNYRKRIERERTETWARAQADVVSRLLDGLDDLERVIDADPSKTSVESLLEGAVLVHRKLRQSLDAVGLEVIDPAGERFDPNEMEALMTLPAESPDEDDTVADVFQKGYRLKDVLVRPARVRVRKFD